MAGSVTDNIFPQMTCLSEALQLIITIASRSIFAARSSAVFAIGTSVLISVSLATNSLKTRGGG
jgi:hypothetical protein